MLSVLTVVLLYSIIQYVLNVDITEEMELKKAMLRKHESQVKWLMEHDGIDVLEKQIVQARFRGLGCGVTYAEGFTQLNGKGRMRPYRLLP